MSSKVKTPDIPKSLADVPPAEPQSWSAFLKSIASFNGNIGSLSAPSFIISGKSLTEYSAYWVLLPRQMYDVDSRLSTLNSLNRFKRPSLLKREH